MEKKGESRDMEETEKARCGTNWMRGKVHEDFWVWARRRDASWRSEWRVQGVLALRLGGQSVSTSLWMMK